MLQAFFFSSLPLEAGQYSLKLFFSKYQAGEDSGETIAGLKDWDFGTIDAASLIFKQFTIDWSSRQIYRSLWSKVSESQSFAEYSLIGLLFSMISVLLVYGLLYWVIKSRLIDLSLL